MADFDHKDDKEQSDERHAPYSKDGARHLYDQENDPSNYSDNTQESGAQSGNQVDPSEATRTGINPSEATRNTENIDATKEKEEEPWKNSYVNPEGKREKVTLKNFFKRKGPLALILSLLGGGGVIISLSTPSLLVIDLKEKMMNAFNDQLAVMDTRTTAMLKKKFNGTVSGICTQKITIRCKFNSMSNKQLKKLEAVGKGNGQTLKVNTDGKTFGIPPRHRVTSIDFTDETTGKVTRIDARNFAGSLQANPNFRGAMLKAYSPKLAGHADATFAKLAARIGINKQKNVTGNTDEERQKSVIDSANGDKIAEAEARVSSTEEPCGNADDCDGDTRTVYRDDVTGETITREQYDQRIGATSSLQNELRLRRSLTSTGKTVTKATLKGALTVTALGLGAVDTACTGYTLIRTVSFAAKYLGKLQLIRFAHLLGNEADATKAMLGDPDTMEYVGEILTTTNSVGMSATDSVGYKYAAYGDVPVMPRSDDIKAENVGSGGNNVELSEQEKERILLNDESTKYINGQLVGNGVMTSLINFIGEGTTTEELDETCSFVKSGWGQTIIIGAAVVGAVVAFFSGGLSVGWGTAAAVGASIAISVAIAMLTPKLADMAAGTFVGEPELTNGNRAGNAATSGFGGYNDETSMNRGVPALQEEDAVEYQAYSKSIIAQYQEVDRATHSPFDATNPNTFMGSIVSNIIPYTSKMSSLSGTMSSITQFATSSFTNLLPKASAADPSAQFKVCNDPEYKELKLAADPFCNIKHGMKKDTLEIDSDTVFDYMTTKGYIDDVTGQSKDADNEYAKYIKHCMERTVSLGGYTEDDDNKGEECIQGSASNKPSKVVNCNVRDDGTISDSDACKQNCTSGSDDDDTECKRNMFRLAYVDLSIDDGMENGMANSGAKSSTSENGAVKSPVTSEPTITSGYGPRGPVAGAPGASRWHAGIDIVAQPTDIVASMAGEVISTSGKQAGERAGDGTPNTITIRHADGLKTLYLHIYPQDVLVKVGDKVTAGQKIGKIGCAGKPDICAGDHLHFNIWIDEVKDKSKYSKYKTAPAAANSSAGVAINPANFLTDNGVTGYKEAVNDN